MNKSFSITNGTAQIKIHKQIYPKEVITQTTYVMLDEFYFLVDIEDEYFVISMKPKKDNIDLDKEVLKFYDELIESQAYLDQLKRTSEIRQTILERALLTQQTKEEKDN